MGCSPGWVLGALLLVDVWDVALLRLLHNHLRATCRESVPAVEALHNLQGSKTAGDSHRDSVRVLVADAGRLSLALLCRAQGAVISAAL